MKTLISVLILTSLITSCSYNRYYLTDKGKDKKFLANYVSDQSKKERISDKPMIVVDGKLYRYDKELKHTRLPLAKNEIKEIYLLKGEAAGLIYGEEGKMGVFFITTKKISFKSSASKDNGKILFLLEGKQISKSEMDKINPGDIKLVEVIKDRERIKQYTSEDYDGVVLIQMKEKE